MRRNPFKNTLKLIDNQAARAARAGYGAHSDELEAFATKIRQGIDPDDYQLEQLEWFGYRFSTRKDADR